MIIIKKFQLFFITLLVVTHNTFCQKCIQINIDDNRHSNGNDGNNDVTSNDDLYAEVAELRAQIKSLQAQLDNQKSNFTENIFEEIIYKLKCEVHGYQCQQKYRIFITPEAGTFDQVRTYCQNQGGDLIQNALAVKPGYNNDYDQVLSKLALPSSIAPYIYYFIGATDRPEEGIWRFLNGAAFVPTEEYFATWAPGEPSNHRNAEHCGTIYKQGNTVYPTSKVNSFYFNDKACNFITRGICEVPI